MPFACLFVPDFPVQAVVRHEVELQDQPVAVLEGSAPLTKVFSANGRAKASGVEVGMTKAEAEVCPNVIWRWRSAVAEASAHAALLDCAWTISPRVEDACEGDDEKKRDTVVLDLSGCERLFGSPEKIANDLKRVAGDVGFDARVAIAGNAEAAVCAARGFPGITVIAEGDESGRLGTLPISSLSMPVELLETLKRWGIHTCAEFAALPDVAVVERLGQEGRRWQLLARGSHSRPLLPKEPPVHFDECMELEFPVELLDPLMFVLNRLLTQLCARLGMHVLSAREIALTLTLEKQDARSKEIPQHIRRLRLPVPSRDSTFLLKLLTLDLQNHAPRAAVIAVKVVATPAPARTRQMGLFLPLSPEPEQLEVTLARIRNTVGDDRVGSPKLLDTHRPNAFRQDRFVVPEPSARATSAGERTTAALRIYRPPLAASVELDGGKPSHISCGGARRKVLALAGPWRTKGDWWSETAWAREEWDVLLKALRPKFQSDSDDEEEETTLYRIYRDRRLRRWFVEGVYD
ncbi:MAG: DNA polymerase Y family protein [Candidatus Acidiferrales bacterium]